MEAFVSAIRSKVELVGVPEFKFLMIDGRIEPGEAPGTFEEAMGALYSVA